MGDLYLLLKFLHVTAAAVWIGAVVTSSLLNARLLRRADGPAFAATAQLGATTGKLIGASAALTLITGGAAMAVADVGFVAWIVWGLAVMVLSMAVGGGLVRRWFEELMDRVRSAGPGDVRVALLQRRVTAAHAALLVLLLSVFWAMVFKPTF
ncbi:MAG TPA: hypothetical protein VFG91_11135 [Woeseiaceae bacterium]|nr:hypothetical protein [Woeseiaceae bacterium]